MYMDQMGLKSPTLELDMKYYNPKHLWCEPRFCLIALLT